MSLPFRIDERSSRFSLRDLTKIPYSDPALTTEPQPSIAFKMADDTALLDATQPLSFAEFLEKMKLPEASDLVKTIKQCDPPPPRGTPISGTA